MSTGGESFSDQNRLADEEKERLVLSQRDSQHLADAEQGPLTEVQADILERPSETVAAIESEAATSTDAEQGPAVESANSEILKIDLKTATDEDLENITFSHTLPDGRVVSGTLREAVGNKDPKRGPGPMCKAMGEMSIRQVAQHARVQARAEARAEVKAAKLAAEKPTERTDKSVDQVKKQAGKNIEEPAKKLPNKITRTVELMPHQKLSSAEPTPTVVERVHATEIVDQEQAPDQQEQPTREHSDELLQAENDMSIRLIDNFTDRFFERETYEKTLTEETITPAIEQPMQSVGESIIEPEPPQNVLPTIEQIKTVTLIDQDQTLADHLAISIEKPHALGEPESLAINEAPGHSQKVELHIVEQTAVTNRGKDPIIEQLQNALDPNPITEEFVPDPILGTDMAMEIIGNTIGSTNEFIPEESDDEESDDSSDDESGTSYDPSDSPMALSHEHENKLTPAYGISARPYASGSLKKPKPLHVVGENMPTIEAVQTTIENVILTMPEADAVILKNYIETKSPEQVAGIEDLTNGISISANKLHELVISGEADSPEAEEMVKTLIVKYEALLECLKIEITEEKIVALIELVKSGEYANLTTQQKMLFDDPFHEVDRWAAFTSGFIDDESRTGILALLARFAIGSHNFKLSA